MKILIAVFFTGLMAIAMHSCQVDASRKGRELARVYDRYLYASEAQDAIPPGVMGKDSILFVQSYIDNWIQNQLVIHQAEQNLPDGQKDFSKELEEYRNSLLIYNYERVLVNQKLDTLISNEELTSFYEKRKNDFPATTGYFRLIAGEIPLKEKKLKKIRTFFYGNKKARLDSLMEYFDKVAVQAMTDTSRWISSQELQRLIPPANNLMFLLKKGNSKFTFPTGESIFFVEVLDFRKAGDPTPLPLVEKQLKQIILNKRKTKIIQDMRHDVKQKAMQKKVIETY